MQQLYNVDCLKLLPTLAPDSVDLVLTDPPYSSGGLHATTRKQPPSTKYLENGRQNSHDFAHDNKDQRSWCRWCVEWLTECHRVMKPGAVIAIFIDWRQLPTLSDAIQMAGFLWQGVAVWDKGNAHSRPRKGGMKQQAEFIVWASKDKLSQERDVYVRGVFNQPKPRGAFHITAKPVELLEELVALAGPGGLVLDPFAGGGSTLLAARNTARPAIGSEIDPTIHQKALHVLERQTA
ncbi:site-specific DNA-methyltransferase [Chromobacterium alkanivorans]|uniref:DNA-methyltransferase n=1 Tax=Chromobacterium alkanivorans TaxID=1071719 RepID=UPI001968924B|nr:site-specific DNA-methyltransferase [Chromobacterium alkanivorans]MBN3005588.1 site-specific DNA-methyltransferase [Chromobacterium alkanivorans]